jgi:arylsulfatase A-like enzyme
VDDGVGTVMATLEELGLDENTLVVYAADQGWMGGTNGVWGMGDHTRPLTAFDRMMHIPLIFRHRGAIPPAGTSDILVSNYDFLPTVLSYLGFGDEIERLTPRSPGRDFSQMLRGATVDWEDVVYYEMETTRAIRTADWKYVHRPGGPYELYDLENDPYEKINLYGQPQHAERQKELEKRLMAFFEKTAEPKYDLYRGGGSKASLLTDRDQRRRP